MMCYFLKLFTPRVDLVYYIGALLVHVSIVTEGELLDLHCSRVNFED